jgi:hypothetical protein
VPQVPTVIGLLVCEKVIVEEHTRNLSLINCFTARKSETFPSAPQQFDIVAFLTDGLGDIRTEVVVWRLDTMDEIYHQAQTVRFLDRLQEVRFLFRVTQCSFPVAGTYQVGLLVHGEPLALHKFVVR